MDVSPKRHIPLSFLNAAGETEVAARLSSIFVGCRNQSYTHSPAYRSCTERDSEQAYLFFFGCAVAWLTIKKSEHGELPKPAGREGPLPPCLPFDRGSKNGFSRGLLGIFLVVHALCQT